MRGVLAVEEKERPRRAEGFRELRGGFGRGLGRFGLRALLPGSLGGEIRVVGKGELSARDGGCARTRVRTREEDQGKTSPELPRGCCDQWNVRPTPSARGRPLRRRPMRACGRDVKYNGRILNCQGGAPWPGFCRAGRRHPDCNSGPSGRQYRGCYGGGAASGPGSNSVPRRSECMNTCRAAKAKR